MINNNKVIESKTVSNNDERKDKPRTYRNRNSSEYVDVNQISL